MPGNGKTAKMETSGSANEKRERRERVSREKEESFLCKRLRAFDFLESSRGFMRVTRQTSRIADFSGTL